MAQSAKEFFEGLETSVDPARTAGMTNTYLFEVDGKQWTVAVDDGAVKVTEGDAGGSDVAITTSEDTFQKIASGEQNPTSAYMTGKIKVKGDMGAAMKLQKLFG
jgi:putative sterol carrier protein